MTSPDHIRIGDTSFSSQQPYQSIAYPPSLLHSRRLLEDILHSNPRPRRHQDLLDGQTKHTPRHERPLSPNDRDGKTTVLGKPGQLS